MLVTDNVIKKNTKIRTMWLTVLYTKQRGKSC